MRRVFSHGVITTNRKQSDRAEPNFETLSWSPADAIESLVSALADRQYAILSIVTEDL